MEKNMDFDLSCRSFSASKLNDIALLRLNTDFLRHTTDLSTRDKLLNYFDLVSKSDLIKVLVIIGPSGERGCEEYFDFYKNAATSESEVINIHRMYNVINQLLLKLVSLDKIVVHGNSGKIISSFLNISLACDYRIVAENSVFQNPCLDLGLLPKGGGAFFLSKIIGLNKVLDIMLSGKNMTALESLALGIVNQVVPAADLEAVALKTARSFSQKPATTLTGIKRLVNYALKDLENYLEFEDKALIHAIKKSVDWKQTDE